VATIGRDSETLTLDLDNGSRWPSLWYAIVHTTPALAWSQSHLVVGWIAQTLACFGPSTPEQHRSIRPKRASKRHQVDPFAHLKDVLERLPTHRLTALSELLPNACLEVHPGARRRAASEEVDPTRWLESWNAVILIRRPLP
jgi:hypothetical protein